MDTTAIEKFCRQCSTSFAVTAEDLAFYEKVSPVFNGKKELIPAPTLCPECRQKRRLAFRNERKLYKRTCDVTGKDIVSIYSPDKPHRVYDYSAWWGDAWDAMEYGLNFSFEKTFTQQFHELLKQVPVLSILVNITENCEYVNAVGNSKSCYCIFNSDFCELCLYWSTLKGCSNCMDCFYCSDSELLYESINCRDCYKITYSQDCYSCRESAYLHACVSCHHCFWCSNLVNASYCINNIQYSQEEYTKKIQQIQPHLANWWFYKASQQIQTENSSGDNLFRSNNLKACFDMIDSRDCAYSDSIFDARDCYDCSSYGGDLERSLESESVGHHSAHIGFSCLTASWVSNVFYSHTIIASANLFGCVGLRNKEYCILNKQYTKAEYEALVPKIIAHMRKTWEWGEFFTPSLSPFGYNETVAAEYFPLAKEEALKLWFNWSDYEAPFPKVEKTIPANKLPNDITKIPDDILNWAIICEVSGKPFRIIKQELEFYRKHNLSIPKRHPDQRHLDRMALRNPRKLWERNCDCVDCEKNHKNGGGNAEPLVEWQNAVRTPDGSLRQTFQTTYAPERPEKVYCEVCYNREVYG